MPARFAPTANPATFFAVAASVKPFSNGRMTRLSRIGFPLPKKAPTVDPTTTRRRPLPETPGIGQSVRLCRLHDRAGDQICRNRALQMAL